MLDAIKLGEVIKETNNDVQMVKLRECILNDGEFEDDLNEFKHVGSEITVANNGILLRGQQIILPKPMREKEVKKVHESHLGIVESIQLLRESVWFPQIDRLIEREIAKCFTCQINSDTSRFQPLQMSELPSQPWQELSIDFYTLPKGMGDYLLVFIDDYSRYPIIERIKSTGDEHVLPVLDQVFSLFGIPEVIQSNNGPPFNGENCAGFAEHYGFKHRKITPYWPTGLMANIK